MTVVFGRSTATPHPYDSALNEWLELGPEDRRIMACNIRHDHRVGEELERDFDRWGIHPRSAPELQATIANYHWDRVRTAEEPDYLSEEKNGHNFLSGLSSGGHIIGKFIRLARVLDLNGLYEVYRWAKDESIREFLDIPSDPLDVSDWLNDRLDGLPAGRVEAFIAAVLGALSRSRREMRHQPTWATAWAAMEPKLDDGPTRWAEAVGIPTPDTGRWLIVLSYTVGEAGAVLRPTQLQAGWYAYHFPSPPEAPQHVGGHPMDLTGPGPADDLLPEYIHQPIDHSISHWVVAGRRCERLESPTSSEFLLQRSNHHSLLCGTYGDSVCAWMPTCWKGSPHICNPAGSRCGDVS
jgi:hypothetical protein